MFTTRTSRFIVIAVTATLLVATAPAVASADDFRFEGNGWGHGVGLSQYGSQARALAGQSAEEIVTTYYPGSSVTSSPSLPSWWTDDPTPLWVGLLEDKSSFEFEADAGVLGICHGLSDCPDPEIGSPVVGETWEFRSTGPNTCQFFVDDVAAGEESNCYARILLGDDTGTRLTIPSKNRTYAHGEVLIRPVTSTTFHVVIELAVEDYLLGIGESILSWAPAALQAQALASRSFAAHKALAIGPSSSFGSNSSVIIDCWCHVEDSSSDQVYKGWSIENYPQFGQNWVAAVAATAGQYIVHPDPEYTENGIILALFNSSNGGSSESNGVAFNTAEQYPYLTPVSDPYSLVGNPQAPWNNGSQVKLAASTVASRLAELTAVDRIRVTERNPSGSAKTVMFEGWNGSSFATTTRTGLWARANLSLRSTFLDRVCRERGPYNDDGCSFFEHNIVRIHDAGFVGSLPGGNYRPEDDMTRSEMASFLFEGLGLPTTSTDYFSDDDGDPNEGAINALAEAGIVVGYPDGTYRPDETVSRAEMAVYLARSLGVDLPDEVPDPFPDVPGDSWFGPAVAEILALGVTTGHQDGTYKPDQLTTREQMAGFIDRALLGGF